MTTMHYLYQEGTIVRKFAVRARNNDELISSCANIKDIASTFGGKVLYEKELSKTCQFMIVSFEDMTFMVAWESLINVKIEDIISCKILVIKSEEANDGEAKTQCDEAKEKIFEHKGAVLKETKVTNGEYRLFLFFTDKDEMLKCEELLGVKGM